MNDCHMHLIATSTHAPYLPAQGYKPDSPITTGPSGSPRPVTTSTGSKAAWKSAQPQSGGGVVHDLAQMGMNGPSQAGQSLDPESSKY